MAKSKPGYDERAIDLRPKALDLMFTKMDTIDDTGHKSGHYACPFRTLIAPAGSPRLT
jgi:hypothetical protein